VFGKSLTTYVGNGTDVFANLEGEPNRCVERFGKINDQSHDDGKPWSPRGYFIRSAKLISSMPLRVCGTLQKSR